MLSPEIIVAVVQKLLVTAVSSGTSYAAQDFFQKRRIERAVDAAASNVAENLLVFFQAERIADDTQAILLAECELALGPVVKDSTALFVGSLNGQKIFDDKFATDPIPQSVAELGVQGLFEMIYVRIASTLCLVPAAVKDWEANAWAENYKRLDNIVAEIKIVFDRVDALKNTANGNNRIGVLRKYLSQREAVEIDITGLRAEQNLIRTMDEIFVRPRITSMAETVTFGKIHVQEDVEYVETFASTGARSIVYGAPGSGKSTWSRWINRLALSSLWDGLVIRVEMKRIDLENPPSALSMLKSAVGINYAESVDSGFIEELALSGSIKFILDGFDEIRVTRRESAVSWIKDLIAYLPNASFTITSRVLASDHLEELGQTWRTWTVEPFDEERIVKYINNWYQNSDLLIF